MKDEKCQEGLNVPPELEHLLYHESWGQLAQMLNDKKRENEILYRNMFKNCKHKTGWCRNYTDCKNCEFNK